MRSLTKLLVSVGALGFLPSTGFGQETESAEQAFSLSPTMELNENALAKIIESGSKVFVNEDISKRQKNLMI